MSPMSLDSSFSDKLRKNHIAQPEEEAGIRAVIEHHRTIVRELDVQEEEIDQAITALLERKGAVRGIRDTHQKFIDDHQSLLSSVLHLPEDVLSKMFSRRYLRNPCHWKTNGPVSIPSSK